MTTCPNCGKVYDTKLKRKHPNIPVQNEFPNSTSIEREQLITGICSNKCWNEYLGIKEDNEHHNPLFRKIFKDRH